MDDFSAIRAAEGDEEVFQAHGLKCRLWRNRFGAWCGYVGVAQSHPAYDVGYESLEAAIDVHGGLTYAERRSDGLWWLGFDCVHAGDLAPMLSAPFSRRGEVYRTKDYARAETERLARQLAGMKEPA